MTNGGNRGNQYTKVAEVQNGPLPKADDTAQKVADDIGVGQSTVKRAEDINHSPQKVKNRPRCCYTEDGYRGSKLARPTALQS